MRLIDADALLEKMKGSPRYFNVKFDIEEMPTAYDVEKVVEQIYDELFVHDIPKDIVTEIVRKGGVE